MDKWIENKHIKNKRKSCILVKFFGSDYNSKASTAQTTEATINAAGKHALVSNETLQ